MSDRTQALIEQVNDARAEGRPLKIVGGGSKDFMGREAAGEPVEVGAHSGIVNYHPVELVLTARGGTPLSEIEAALAEYNQMLAFEPPHFGGDATIGGTLACNQSGPARPWSGSVRDMVLGIRLINGRGEALRFGGEVMKNVAGYDLSRMQAGALGTLGIISEVSLKVMPRPAATLTLVREVEAGEAIEQMNRLAGQAKPLTGACWLDGRLYLRLAGAESAVKGTAQQWGGDVLENGDAFWASVREQEQAFFAGDAPLWRFSMNPTAAPLLPDHDWLIDWGGAQRWLRGDFQLTELETLAREAGGQVSLYRGGDRSGEVFHSQPPALRQLHQRLKSSLDPDGIFNPGRLYSWM